MVGGENYGHNELFGAFRNSLVLFLQSSSYLSGGLLVLLSNGLDLWFLQQRWVFWFSPDCFKKKHKKRAIKLTSNKLHEFTSLLNSSCVKIKSLTMVYQGNPEGCTRSL